MSEHAVAQTQKANTPQETTKSVISLQRRPTNLPEPTIMQEWLHATATFTEPRFGYDFSRVPAHKDMVQETLPLLRTRTMVQRFPKNGTAGSAPCATCPEAASTQIPVSAEPAAETAESFPMVAPSAAHAEPMTEPVSPETETTPAPAEPTTESAAPGETTASGLIVEDSVTELAPGQMKKSEFLSQLRAEVTRAAEAAMAGTGQTTADCPYLDYWFGYYKDKDSRHIERAIRRYAPETSRATTARDYIPMVVARVSRSVEVWARTGEITGVPEGMPLGLPGMGLLGGIGRLISGIGGIFFKARNGGARMSGNPRAIQARLGSGQPLDSGVRSRMESAFGMDFSQVRTHIDSTASRLSNSLNARAFTVGRHVAFGSGEYKPGTLFGDALIAHEMAHVMQQRGADDAAVHSGNISYNALEQDADIAATTVVTSLWGRATGTLADVAWNAGPRLRSGLTLQRCATTRTAAPSHESAAGAAHGELPCPEFISLSARVKDPTVSDACGGRCRMELGCCQTPRGTCRCTDESGAAITATVEASEGCTGELAFMQNLTSERRRTLSDGTQQCMSFKAPHRDGGIPWKGCVLSVTSAGRHTVSTDDCPYIRLCEELEDRPGVHMTAASVVTESFKTFLLWKPTRASSRRPIANVTWGWSGSTTRRQGTDCASRWTEPRGSHTDGNGRASTDRPVTSPTVQEDYRWEECER